MTAWYDYQINVPYGNINYDTQLGGSHDIDVQTPLDTPITSLVSGVITDISNPAWGRQITIKLDQAINGVPYLAYLHLDAIAPGLSIGQHINSGQLIGYSGGANSNAQLNSSIASSPYQLPTGLEHFIDTSFMSSGPQTGIALSYGPQYGTGAGWSNISSALDPTSLLQSIQKSGLQSSSGDCCNGDFWCQVCEYLNGGPGTPSATAVCCVSPTKIAQGGVQVAASSGLGYYLLNGGIILFGAVLVIAGLVEMFKKQAGNIVSDVV